MITGCFPIYLYHFKFLSAVFCAESFVYKPFVFMVKFIPKHFIILDATINRIVFLSFPFWIVHCCLCPFVIGLSFYCWGVTVLYIFWIQVKRLVFVNFFLILWVALLSLINMNYLGKAWKCESQNVTFKMIENVKIFYKNSLY